MICQTNPFSYEIKDEILILSINTDSINMYNVNDILNSTGNEFRGLNFKNVIINITPIIKLDSTAVGALMVAIDRMRKKKSGGVLVLVSTRSSHLKIRDMLKSEMKIFCDNEEAIHYIREFD